MSTLTLADWLKGVRINPQQYGQAVVIPDCRAIDHTRTYLWDLADYFVSSVTGGAIWLLPRALMSDGNVGRFEGGAYITDDRLIAYLDSPAIDWKNGRKTGDVQTWKGEHIGHYIITKSWRTPVRGGDWYVMCQVSIRLDDGRMYYGRSQGPGMIVKAKRAAEQRRGR